MKFQEPPQGRGPISRLVSDEDRQQLRAKPGEWALFLEGVTRSKVNSLTSWAKRNPGFECTTRNVEGELFDGYLRYVGEAPR